MDASEIYADARARVIDLVTSAPADSLDAAVPATPDWTGRDLLAHMVGVQADVVSGNLEGAGSQAWNDNHVESRKGRSVDELVEEWRTGAAQFDAMAAAAPSSMVGALVADLLHHELDLRGALGQAPPGEALAAPVDFGVNLMAGFLDRRLRKLDKPALRVRADGQEWTLGEGEPAATLTTSPVEFFRVLAGRRSANQVRALEWDGDPDPYLDVLSAFGPLSAADVDERLD